jgi:hypothetical protein
MRDGVYFAGQRAGNSTLGSRGKPKERGRVRLTKRILSGTMKKVFHPIFRRNSHTLSLNTFLHTITADPLTFEMLTA